MSILKRQSTYPAGGPNGGLSAAALQSVSATAEDAIGRLDAPPAGSNSHRRAAPPAPATLPVSALNAKSRYGGGDSSAASVNGSSDGRRSVGGASGEGGAGGGLDLEQQLALVQAFQSSSEVERASELATDIRELRLAIAAAQQHEATAAQRKSEAEHIRRFASSVEAPAAVTKKKKGASRRSQGTVDGFDDDGDDSQEDELSQPSSAGGDSAAESNDGGGDADVSFTIEELVNLEAAHRKQSATAPAADAEALAALQRDDVSAAEDALAAEHCEWRERCQRALNLAATRRADSTDPGGPPAADSVSAMLPPFNAAIELRLTATLDRMRGAGSGDARGGRTDRNTDDAPEAEVDLSTAIELHYL